MLKFDLKYHKYSTHGAVFMQINFTQPSISELLTDIPAIKEYLGSGLFRGIGKKTADRLVDCFGKDTLVILDSDISRIAEVKGIASGRVAAIKEAWSLSKTSPYRAAMSRLLGLGLSLNLSLKICEYYGSRTLDIIKSNPYKLASDLDGVGFKTADGIALTVGIAPDSDTRYSAGLLHSLKESTAEGHCYLPMDVLLEKSTILLTTQEHIPARPLLYSILRQLLASGILVSGGLSGSVYLPPFYRAELRVAGLIRRMAAIVGSDSISRVRSNITSLENWLYREAGGREAYFSLGQVLSEEQKAAILMAESHQIAIITGGPGCGKTFTLKTLMRRLSGKADVALVAPTGKAAKRLTNVTGHSAKTIHRLLEWSIASGGFCRNQSNPLRENFVIIDEASMVDLFLFNSLLKALPPEGQLLIVGDRDQLPSVGPGMVLRDLIHAELVPTVRLTLIKRQQNDSGIITAAHQINQGITPELPKVENPIPFHSLESDCLWLDVESPEEAAREIVKTLDSLKDAGFDLMSTVQVLTPMKKGAAGTKNLNMLLQQHINPPSRLKNELRIDDEIYRLGDRVIQTRNDYNTGVMNGEEGRIVAVEKEPQKILVEFEGGVIAPYTNSTISDIVHSYALTIHKSQGSEYQVVIVPVLMSHYRMLTRQILYTGITRAQSLFIGIGQQKALSLAVNTDKPAQRYTQLAQYLVATELPEIQLSDSSNSTEKLTSVQGRLRELCLTASKGQMTKIGSLALQIFELTYGTRPCKKPERVGGMNFSTYHYPEKAISLLDQAIRQVLSN
jgi:exodeoxyribonuclease V alpha subunit